MALNDWHKPTERVLSILELLASTPEGITLSQISDKLSIPKGTLFPIIHTLNHHQFISLDKITGKYQIALRTYLIGEAFASHKSAFQFVHDEMHSIVSELEEICQMGILDNGNVLYVSKVDSKEPIRLLSYVGKRLPAYTTALGKALLSGLTKREILKLYPDGLKAITPHTITDFNILFSQLDEIKRTHLAHEKEEVMEHLECYAVPLCSNSTVIASLSVSVPIFRLSPDKALKIQKKLLTTKTKIDYYFKVQGITLSNFLCTEGCYRL